LVILFTAKKLPECNPAVIVLFQPFSALKASQIIGLVAVAVTAVYTAITALDFSLPPSSKLVKRWVLVRIKKDQEPISPPENDVRSNGTLQEARMIVAILRWWRQSMT